MKWIKRKFISAFTIVALIICAGSAAGIRPTKHKKTPPPAKVKITDPAVKEILPPEGVETVKQFLAKRGITLDKKKLMYGKVSLAYYDRGTAHSMVKVVTAEANEYSLLALRNGILLGYRVSAKVSQKIGEIELGFSDKTTFKVQITPDYFYIKIASADIPFKSVALSRHIKNMIDNSKNKSNTVTPKGKIQQ